MFLRFSSLWRVCLLAGFWLAVQAALPAQDEEPPPAAAEPEQAGDTPPQEEAPPEDENTAKPKEDGKSEDDSDDAVPQAYPEDRYLTLWDKNPFLREVVPTVQKKEDFSKDWSLAGMSASGGVYTVSISNKQTGKFTRIKEGETGGEFRIISVNYHKDRTKSSVKVARGSETADLTFDSESAQSRPLTVQNTQAPVGGVPGQGGQNPNDPANPNLPPGAQASLRGPNGQPLPPGAPGQNINRPGAAAYGAGRAGSPAGSNLGAQAIDPATGAPIPGAINRSPINPGVNPAVNPGIKPGPAQTPGSRRRQLIPAPLQQNRNPAP